MFGLGSQELFLVLLVVVVLFGAKRLPQLGEALGKGIRNFKSGLKTPMDKEEGRDDGRDERDDA
ncbi:MAG: twin-arginine translocase TatA/TatE family subunit [Desulfuromonas thiophila]|jgi:sec-independent protein translocase protein TatA|nr:twin-arginine translocase TatA/TatE family subunit [Desulfuromonas thiophila]